MLRMLGITNFPWLMIIVWSIVGFVIGIIVKVLFWRSTPGGQIVSIYFAAVGAALGCFLSLCYYVIDAVSNRTF
jgi:uncharacterized membrane protein YeaQ/YmgE (transglycosylase-associated protein family)